MSIQLCQNLLILQGQEHLCISFGGFLLEQLNNDVNGTECRGQLGEVGQIWEEGVELIMLNKSDISMPLQCYYNTSETHSRDCGVSHPSRWEPLMIRLGTGNPGGHNYDCILTY